MAHNQWASGMISMSPNRVLRPIPYSTPLVQPVLTEVLEYGSSAIDAYDGCFAPEVLAAAVCEAQRWEFCAWLRLRADGPDDIARLICDACAERWSVGGNGTAGSSGIDMGNIWQAAPEGAVVVIEIMARPTRRCARAIRRLVDRMPDRHCSVVLVLHVPGGDHRLSARVDRRIGAAELEYRVDGSNSDWEQRLVALCGGRASVLHNVLEAASVWPTELLERGVVTAHGASDMASSVSAELLRAVPSAAYCALASAARSGYSHMGDADVPSSASALRPWLTPLEDGWTTVSPAWRSTILGIGPPRDDDHSSERLEWDCGHTHWCVPERSRPERDATFVDCQLLGGFEVVVDGRRIEAWHGRIGQSIVRYLLAAPSRSASRDELLEAFWPSVDPHVSRNRLQVAISTVRRSLGDASKSPFIVYADGRYLVDPRSAVTTDVDRFEVATRQGRDAERDGDVPGARTHYLDAIGLYRGDFAPDLPYDEWTILIRERMRLAYLDVLERAGRMSMAADEIDDCIDIARRMLDQDACREDAHRVLMRCYARQGKSHLVDYQYDFCVRVLDGVLRTRPSEETIATHREQRSLADR